MSVNGERVNTPGTRVDPLSDRVSCGGQEVRPPDACTYILLNKPRGYLVSAGDPHHDRTVYDLLKDVEARVFPVGRLDMDTGGALLLTDDGDLAHRLMHPSFEVDKVYRVGVERQPSPETLARLKAGVVVDGKKTSRAAVRVVGAGREGTEMEIVIHEGRNRQVRKMCEAVGHEAIWLERTVFAGLSVEGMERGAWRPLEPVEVSRLRSSAGLEGGD